VIRRGGVGANRREGMRVANASAWSPSLYGSALTAWVNESSYSATGGAIDSIANFGTAGGAFTASTTARPTLSTVLGRSVAVFDGTNNTSGGGPTQSQVIPNASAYTWIFAFKLTSLSATAATSGWLEPNAFQDTGSGAFYPLAVTTVGVRSGHYDGLDKQTTETTVTLGTMYVLSVTFDGTTVTQRLNGGSKTVAAGAVSMAASNAMRLGASQGGLRVAFTLAEMIGLSTTLSAAQLAAPQTYLVNKWGATL